MLIYQSVKAIRLNLWDERPYFPVQQLSVLYCVDGTLMEKQWCDESPVYLVL